MQKGAGMDRLRATGTESISSTHESRPWTRIGLSSLIIALCVAGLAITSPCDLDAATCSIEPPEAASNPDLVESHLQQPEPTPRSFRVRTGGYETNPGR